MKKLIKKLLRESLLLEGVSEITYHFTKTNKAIKILETNKINLTPAFGTPSDSSINKNKLYYLSTTSSRSSDIGYAASLSKDDLVRITLNGRALSNNYEVTRVDYWQRSKNPDSYQTPGGDNTGKGFYKQISRQDELEDRLISDENEIKPVNKYTIMIEVLNGEQEQIEYMKQLCINLNIQFYAYDDERYFNASIKNKAINVTPSNTPTERRESNYYNSDIIGYLGFNNEPLKEKIFNDLEKLGVGDIERLKTYVNERIEKLNYYLRVGDDFYFKDYVTNLSNAIHNSKSSSNEIERYLSRQIGLDMKRFGVNSIKDYLDAKRWNGKKKQSEYNEELNEKFISFIDNEANEVVSKINDRLEFEFEDKVYNNIMDYEPFNNFFTDYITNLKNYVSNFVMNNDDMFRYSYMLSTDQLRREVKLDKKELSNILNQVMYYSDGISTDDVNTYIYYLLSDFDSYNSNEIKKAQTEYHEQFNK